MTAQAYDAGARYVHVLWQDTPTQHAHLQHVAPEYLDYFPDYEVSRYRQMVDEGWARLSLTGAAYPDISEDVDPDAMRRIAVMFDREKIKFYKTP